MKSDIHPDYRPVVFHDTTADFSFITRSTVETSETIEWEDGNTYPLKKVEISSKSHPFYTGTMTIVDTAGRVERFERRYGRRRKEEGEGGGDAPVAEAAAEAPTDAAPAAEAVTDAPAAEAVTDAPAEEAAAEAVAVEAEAPAADEGAAEES